MLVLNLVLEGQQIKKKFAKEEVTIGPMGADVDLPLPLEALKTPHIKIIKLDTGYHVVNAAHDPYVLLNQLPFGKRPLQIGDCLSIKGLDVTVEKEAPLPSASPRPLRSLKEEVDASPVSPPPRHIERALKPPRSTQRRASAWIWLSTAIFTLSATVFFYALTLNHSPQEEMKEIAELEPPSPLPEKSLPPPGLSGY